MASELSQARPTRIAETYPVRQCKTHGSLGMRAAIGVLQFAALFIGFVVVHRLDSATQQNSAILAQHSVKLAIHDKNFESLMGHFSPEFALKLRKYMPSENR
jgi:hypothetical protein